MYYHIIYNSLSRMKSADLFKYWLNKHYLYKTFTMETYKWTTLKLNKFYTIFIVYSVANTLAIILIVLEMVFSFIINCTLIVNLNYVHSV